MVEPIPCALLLLRRLPFSAGPGEAAKTSGSCIPRTVAHIGKPLPSELLCRRRRVLLDFGGREFGSSVGWFLRMYPLAFTEVYVYEAVKGRFRIPPASGHTCQVQYTSPPLPRYVRHLHCKSPSDHICQVQNTSSPFPDPAWLLQPLYCKPSSRKKIRQVHLKG